MKIKLAIFIGSLFFLGCTSTHKLKVEDFFVENDQTILEDLRMLIIE
ncbi:MAG: hypothetical protein IAA47_08680 [Candidatus Fusobacterium pullicola]|uniref:Uncharacterized protein n=1 Tax=Candidatus Fusobacterium pullicola TaxID=2838601 RepID=A0A9E2L0X8_9FUSO|nr:hypothetical protein [Candidatus Fusobacterium pullicola]